MDIHSKARELLSDIVITMCSEVIYKCCVGVVRWGTWCLATVRAHWIVQDAYLRSKAAALSVESLNDRSRIL
jgi:hypothetical protein